MSLLHADADCFFASVELRHRRDLAGRPVAVATHIVMSASYAARKHGVRGAMPLRQAMKLCPELVVLPPRADYQSVGEELMSLFWRYADQVEPGSMEEAFIDVGRRDPVTTAEEIRLAASDELDLPVTIGIARTKLMAKLASRRAKPDGLLVIDAEEEQRIRRDLSIEDLWGVGPATANRLAEVGIVRLPQLADFDEPALRQVVGTAMARRLLSIRDGTDDATVRQLGPRRSISASRTAMHPSAQWPQIQRHADEVIELALGRLGQWQAGQALTHRIDLQVRYADRTEWSGQLTLAEASRDHDLLRRRCRHLLLSSGVRERPRPVLLIMVMFRLTGVPGSRLQEALPLF